MIKRISSRLAITALSFTIGVCSSAWLASYVNAPDPVFPQPDEVAPPAVASPACFPGSAVYLEQAAREPLYFPTNLPNSDFQDVDKRLFEWYSRKLAEMGEPSLYAPAGAAGERYRVLLLPSFLHPVAVRVERFGDKRIMVVKELDRYDAKPSKLIRERTRPLSEQEWNRFRYLVDQSCFWQMPVRGGEFGEDGAQVILEGVFGGRYKVVDRWSPSNGPYQDACNYLLKISGLKEFG